jgi:hypothetical protein
MSRYMVGIDPGVNTGFALWEPLEKRLSEVGSTTIVVAMRRVEAIQEAGALSLVVFEDARLRTGYFGERSEHKKQGAGSIKRDCSVWEEWLTVIGAQYVAMSPLQKGAKLDDAPFRKITGWAKRSNSHARDAAMLVYGRSPGWRRA